MHVLIVEDDESLGQLVSRVLSEENVSATWCTTAQEGLRLAREGCDLIILDWMLPDGEGPAFCEALRGSNVLTPILMLTARGEVHDRVRGLRAGADYYLVKPFEVEELLARIDALMRRRPQLTRLAVGDICIDRLERRCTLKGQVVELTSQEFEFLLRLTMAEGEPVSRATLLRDVWRMEGDPGSGLLDVQVSRLRDKLGRERIETVRGVGYRLVRST